MVDDEQWHVPGKHTTVPSRSIMLYTQAATPNVTQAHDPTQVPFCGLLTSLIRFIFYGEY